MLVSSNCISLSETGLKISVLFYLFITFFFWLIQNRRWKSEIRENYYYYYDIFGISFLSHNLLMKGAYCLGLSAQSRAFIRTGV